MSHLNVGFEVFAFETEEYSLLECNGIQSNRNPLIFHKDIGGILPDYAALYTRR
jgi:hypothetical protein